MAHADAEDASFLSFLQTTALAGIDAFVNRQQSRVQQPTQLASAQVGGAGLGGNILLIGGALLILFLVLFAG